MALRYNSLRRSIDVAIDNKGSRPRRLTIQDNRYGTGEPVTFTVGAGKRARRAWPLAANHEWYDLTIYGEEFDYNFAGRVETGRPGISDPAAA